LKCIAAKGIPVFCTDFLVRIKTKAYDEDILSFKGGTLDKCQNYIRYSENGEIEEDEFMTGNCYS